tara:strand:- start:609 stop:824 length:216 start_codon:yes stop_codon:yes gene_type:complete
MEMTESILEYAFNKAIRKDDYQLEHICMTIIENWGIISYGTKLEIQCTANNFAKYSTEKDLLLIINNLDMV